MKRFQRVSEGFKRFQGDRIKHVKLRKLLNDSDNDDDGDSDGVNDNDGDGDS